MERFNRESLKLILRYVPPKDALALRACSRVLNKLIIENQLYWWYQVQNQHKPVTRHVHVKPFTLNCIDMRYKNNMPIAYQYLMEHHNYDGEIDAFHFTSGFNVLRTCQHFIKLIPISYCANPKHYEDIPVLLLGDQLLMETPEFKAIESPVEHGYQMYQYLFTSMKRIRTQVNYVKTEHIPQQQMVIQNQLDSMHVEKRKLKRKLQLLDQHEELTAKLAASPFHKKRMKSYHKKKIIKNMLK